MDQTKQRPVKKAVDQRFQTAAAMMIKALLKPTKVKEVAERIVGKLGHKKGSITTPMKQQREAKKRANIRSHSKMNKK